MVDKKLSEYNYVDDQQDYDIAAIQAGQNALVSKSSLANQPSTVAVNILAMNSGTTNTPTTSDPLDYVKLEMGPESLAAVDDGYDSIFDGVTGFAKVVKSTAGAEAFRFTMSGLITSDSTGDLDHFYMRAMDDAGNPLTGTIKRYSAGKVAGVATSDIGFTLIGVGLIPQNGFVEIEVAKDFVGTCVLDNVIFTIEKVGAA